MCSVDTPEEKPPRIALQDSAKATRVRLNRKKQKKGKRSTGMQALRGKQSYGSVSDLLAGLTIGSTQA